MATPHLLCLRVVVVPGASDISAFVPQNLPTKVVMPAAEPTAVRSERPLRILCLDGGGIKGYTSLLILQRLLRELHNQEIDNGNGRTSPPKPCEIFDLMVGTSTGGLIATMLGRLSLSIDDCLKQYRVVGQKVFGEKPMGGKAGMLFRGLISSPFYSVGKLQAKTQALVEASSPRTGSSSHWRFCDVEQADAPCKV